MFKVFVTLYAFVLPVSTFSAELLMVHEESCFWCEAWEDEIGPIYSKTAEGKFAPLSKIDLADSINDDRISNRVIFTPTFILIEKDQEIARIEGYPGEDFFWVLLEEALYDSTEYVGSEN